MKRREGGNTWRVPSPAKGPTKDLGSWRREAAVAPSSQSRRDRERWGERTHAGRGPAADGGSPDRGSWPKTPSCWAGFFFFTKFLFLPFPFLLFLFIILSLISYLSAPWDTTKWLMEH